MRESTDEYKKNKTIIETQIKTLKGNKYLNKQKQNYIRINRYLSEKIAQSEPFNKIADILPINRRVRLITDDEYNEIIKESEKSFNETKQFFKQKEKDYNIIYAIEKFQDLNFSSKNIITVISTFSVLFLCTGFLYNWYFLRYFGINIQYYFSISDYISSSIGKIFIPVSMLIPIILLLMWDYLFPGEQSKRDTLKPKRNIFLQPFGFAQFILVPIIIVASLYLKIFEMFIYSLTLFIFFFSIKIIAIFALKLENSFKKYVIGASIIFFFLVLFTQATTDIYYISSSNTNNVKEYEFTFDDESIIEHNDFILLSSNSQYFFFYDKKNELPIIVPVNKIKIVKYIGEKKYSKISKILNYFSEFNKGDIQQDN